METVRLTVGSICSNHSGLVFEDSRREVAFEGDELASLCTPGKGRDGRPTDTRGRDETLYRTAGDPERLLAHVHSWSQWQGEPTIDTLTEVTPAMLDPGGLFEMLGLQAGLSRPLTLDEALERMDGSEALGDG